MTPQSSSKRKKKIKRSIEPFSGSESDIQTPQRQRRRANQQRGVITVSSSEETGNRASEESLTAASIGRSHDSGVTRTPTRRRSHVSSDDSMMEELKQLSTKHQRNLMPLKHGVTAKKTSVLSNADHESSEDVVTSGTKRTPRSKQNNRIVLSSDECSNSDHTQIDLSTGKSPHLAGRRRATSHMRSRLRAKKETNQRASRREALDRLTQRRAANKAGESSQSTATTMDGTSSDGASNEDAENLRHGNLDEYEEDFVTDDDDTLGAPVGLDEMPLEFTMHAKKKPFEYFKDVVEWMVHNKLNPAFARNDQIYGIAIDKMEDMVRGLTGSKFVSTVWKPKFLKALKTYPDVEEKGFSATLMDQNCEACGRSGHPAKHRLTFTGKPYNRHSLEAISSSEDSDRESSDEAEEGQTSFVLGRRCNANAVTAHMLHHWRYQLNQIVLDCLHDEGYLAPEKIVEREAWSTKKRSKYANDLVDAMVADNRMRTLHREFKENIEAAISVKVSPHTSCYLGVAANGMLE